MDRLTEWVTTDQGAALTGYSTTYVRNLARSERIEAQKVGRDWLVNRDALLAYKRRMDALGPQKHNPWRADLPEGQGRQSPAAGHDLEGEA